MRILHTADWHLGRAFREHPLLPDQEAFVAWLTEFVRDEGIDLVVIAGDVYDRAVPPREAVALLGRALTHLRATGAHVVAIAGNHDSHERLGFAEDLLATSGVILRGERTAEPVTLEFADGPLVVVPAPFLDPSLMPRDPESHDEATPRTHETVLRAALDAARTRIASGTRSIAVAHAFVQGGEGSESERPLAMVGGAELVSASVFDGFSYAALGHLHRPQECGAPHVAYSGSPLAYSFSEEHEKSVRVIDLDVRGTARVEAIPVPVGRGVVTLTGTLEELMSDPRHADRERDFVRARLTDAEEPSGAMDVLRRRFPYALELSFVRDQASELAQSGSFEHVEARSPLDLARDFWLTVTGRPVDSEREELLIAALAETSE